MRTVSFFGLGLREGGAATAALPTDDRVLIGRGGN